MVKILANDGIDANGKKLLEAAGFEVNTEKVAQDKLAAALVDYDAVLVRSATKIRRDIMDACPNLKLIGRGGVGLDNIEVDYARQRGIRVINTPASSSVSVAEMVFAHLLSGCRFLQLTNRVMAEKGNEEFNSLKKRVADGIELHGKTLGILGFGRIGQEVAKMAIGMGMKVLAFDPYVESVDLAIYLPAFGDDFRLKHKIETCSKDEILRNSDFITFHIPFSEGDKAVIGAAELAIMRQGVGLVNCARGGVIDERALLDALNSGQVAFAGLDVFEKEPPVFTDILKHPHVSLSPHTGGSTKEAQNRIGIELAEKIIFEFKK